LSQTEPASAAQYTWSKFIPDNVVFNWQVKQASGQSTTDLMSQKSITDLLALKMDKTQVQNTTGSSTTDPISQNAVTTALAGIRTGIDSTAVNITASSGTQYYWGRTISGTISGSATVVLTNCTGTITISGTTAKIYANNCPNLTISGKTTSNWRNVRRDGRAEYVYVNSELQIATSGDTMSSIIIYTPSGGIQSSDIITVHLQHDWPDYADGTILTMKTGQYNAYTVRTGNSTTASRTFPVLTSSTQVFYIGGCGNLLPNEEVSLLYFKIENWEVV